jgi:alkyl hydroperoxide reductase subunit AhpF
MLAFFGGGGSKHKSPLKKKQRELARAMLSTLEKEARLVLFSESDGCKDCGKAERLLTELASLSPRLTCDTLSLSEDAVRAAELGIDKAPGIAILNGEGKSPGIRYYGIPLGFEFEAFLEAIVNTAHDRPGLEPGTVAGLDRLEKPVTITVFVAQH